MAAILETTDLRSGYATGDVLQGVSVAIDEHEIVGVLGRNGVGKSTLMRTLVGLLRTRHGRITFQGNDVSHEPAYKRARRGVGYVPQGREVFPDMSVEDNLRMGTFINERHRQDMADIAHLVLCRGHLMYWRRLLERTGPDWPLLLAQLQMFRYVYPGYRAQVPRWVLEELLERARGEAGEPPAQGAAHETTRGTVISRFSFAIDVNEWGFHDLREEMTQRMERHPAVLAIGASDVWDERSDHESSAELVEVEGELP